MKTESAGSETVVSFLLMKKCVCFVASFFRPFSEVMKSFPWVSLGVSYQGKWGNETNGCPSIAKSYKYSQLVLCFRSSPWSAWPSSWCPARPPSPREVDLMCGREKVKSMWGRGGVEDAWIVISFQYFCITGKLCIQFPFTDSACLCSNKSVKTALESTTPMQKQEFVIRTEGHGTFWAAFTTTNCQWVHVSARRVSKSYIRDN